MNCIVRFENSIYRLFFGVICLVSVISAQSTLSVDVSKATYTINKELYGGLLENFGRDIYTGLYVGVSSSVPTINGMRKDAIAAFKECGVSILDWPGGCFAENYNWKNGIGPKANRPGGDMTNGMGTDEYFQLCDSIGSLPYITANTFSLPASGMTAWLNYIDSLYPNRIKYWKMGNERWGGCEGAQVPKISISAYIKTYNEYKAAIPSKFSGKFARIADGGTGDYLYSPTWIDSLLKCEMGSVEGVTLHYYGAFPPGASINFPENEYYDRINNVAWKLNSKLTTYDSVMTKYDPDFKVGLMVDEWGSWYSNVTNKDYPQSTCRDAVIASVALNLFNNRCKRIKMACVAQPVDVIQSFVLTENPAQNRIVKTPTFYVYKMYKVHQLAKMVPESLSTSFNQNIPIISASSSVDSTKKLHISLCNTHATATHTVTITLNNAPEYSLCTGTIINGPAFSSYNDFGTAENVNIQNFTGAQMSGNKVTVTMPAHSVVTLEFTPSTAAIGKFTDPSPRSWSVKSLPGGAFMVQSSASEVEVTCISLALFDINGHRVIASDKVTMKPGEKSIIRQQGGRPLCTGVYILNINDGKRMISRKVEISR